MNTHARRYPGPRIKIVYGQYQGMQRFAVVELQRIIQSLVPYVVEVVSAQNYEPEAGDHGLAVGTAADHPLIRRCVSHGWIEIPAGSESFAYRCGDAPFLPLERLVVITGADAKGVINGVADFGAAVIGNQCVPLTDSQAPKVMQRLAPLACHSQPVVANRGVWTWGYVIYDYRAFLDQMARLKMNMLTIWNDCAPLNLGEVVDYAHDRGIRLVCGFHWGWGIEGLDLASRSDCDKVRDQVLAHYEQQYHPCGIDGIYFQTLTEHTRTAAGGASTAALARDWVNRIGGALLDRYPDLYIQFGLHATSILDRYPDLQSLDPRITIVWEDAGVTPYAYTPTLTHPAGSHMHQHGLGTFAGTLDYSRKLATFRGEAEFGLCAKGYSNLDWENEFEHHGPFVLGERSTRFIRRRADAKQPWNHFINSGWSGCARAQATFYRQICRVAPGPVTAMALVEDGLLEAAIQPAVALFAETVWDPGRPLAELTRRAQGPYYQGI